MDRSFAVMIARSTLLSIKARESCLNTVPAHHEIYSKVSINGRQGIYLADLNVTKSTLEHLTECILGIEALATSKVTLEWLHPPGSSATRRNPLFASASALLKEQLGQSGHRLLLQFLAILKHLDGFLIMSQHFSKGDITSDFNPYLDLFKRHVQPYLDQPGMPRTEADLGSIVVWPGTPYTVQAPDPSRCEAFKAWLKRLNTCINTLRAEAGASGFRNKLNDYLRPSQENHKAMKGYVNDLFKAYDRLLIIRLDLGYQPEAERPSPAAVDNDLQRFRQALQKWGQARYKTGGSPLDALCGYAMKVGHYPEVGYHGHAMLIFDATQVPDSATAGPSLTEAVGRYWVETITGDRGTYFPGDFYTRLPEDSRFPHYRYRKAGIGLYSPGDPQESIEDAISYLCDTDYFYRLQRTGGRTFFKGQSPKRPITPRRRHSTPKAIRATPMRNPLS